jgi:hypothetical protein
VVFESLFSASTLIPRKAWTVAAALGVLLALPAHSDPQRIQFEKRRSSAVLQGMAPGMNEDYKEPREYVLKASAGQVMTVKLKGEGASYSVSCPGEGGTDAGAAEWSMTLPEAGDYTIRVNGTGEKDSPFSLEVGVTGKPKAVEVRGVTGTYLRNDDSSLEVVELPGGKVEFALLAFWKGARWEEYGPNMGQAYGEVPLVKGVAVYKEEECRLTMRFSAGKVEIEQGGDCLFGHNVSADGVYRRTSVCAAPKDGFEE